MIRGTTRGKLGHLLRLRRRGAEVLEAALVMPILLALAFGTVEFGYYFYVEHNLEGAAREGARAALPAKFGDSIDAVDVGARLDAVEVAVDRVMSATGYQPEDYKIVADVDQSDSQNKYIVVNVDMDWNKINEGLRPMRMIKPDHNLVRGSATMRLEF
jgi:Flp pilus assembly protein TadG